MNASAATIFDMARQGNAAAMGKAEKWMPKLEVNELISMVISVWEEKEHRHSAPSTEAYNRPHKKIPVL